MRDLFLFAGESSADLHGEKLIHALRLKDPELKIWGVGGPKMRAAGLDCILPMEEFQVMGFIDVFLALPRLLRHFYFIKKTLLQKQPTAVVFIDYPGFNLRMENALRKKGYTKFLCHYICPSVWAWGKKRIPEMARNLDLLITILPFEKNCFKDTNLNIHYAGHPLIKRIPLNSAHKGFIETIALFPGSRTKEIERNFKGYLTCAKELLKKHPHLKFIVSLSHPRFKDLLKKIMEKENLNLPLEPDSYTLMKQADLALAKSGTITLELALHNVPTVVTYAISPLDTFLAKHIFKIRLPYYCLVNIIYSGEVFPELIGPALTQNALFNHADKFIEDGDYRQECLTKCAAVRTLLGEQDASTEAATAIFNKIFC
ncbi:MAG: lipid-A-disaccharide synthase [Chlamydiota bacterium]